MCLDIVEINYYIIINVLAIIYQYRRLQLLFLYVYFGQMDDRLLGYILEGAILEASVIGQLSHIRDIFLHELSEQILLNRILQQRQNQCNSLKSASDSENVGNIVKLEEIGLASQSSPIFRLISHNSKRRIWKNNISHNSSLRNDTKNIPKNYGKAILNFIQKSPQTRKLVNKIGANYSQLMVHVRRSKKGINTIEGLRKMWGCDDNTNQKITKCIRILSYDFMRKYGLRYIFRSRIRNYGAHIKYRSKMIEGIENPDSFKHIKDY